MNSFLSFFSCESKQSNITTPVKKNTNKFESSAVQTVNIFDKTTSPFVRDLSKQKVAGFDYINNSQKQGQIQTIIKIAQKLKNKPPSQRKEIQEDFIKKNTFQITQLYLIQNRWYQEYLKYLADPVRQVVKPIDNNKILTKGSLKVGLIEQQDYKCVSKNIWVFLSTIYGGEPAIKKYTHLPVIYLAACGIKKNIRLEYLNATIQCILSVPQFSQYFLNKLYNQIIHQTKYSKKSFSIGTHKIVLAFHDNPAKIKDLQDFQYLFESKLYDGGVHEPAELIQYYFEKLQDQLNPIKEVILQIPKNSQEAFFNYKIKHSTIVNHLFSGQKTNVIKCLSCNNISIVYQSFFFIKVEISNGRNTLQGNLNKYFLQEKINEYACERCRYKTKATKQHYFSYLPQYFIISLNRLVNLKYKCNEYIEYPFILRLQRYFQIVNQDPNYTLESLIFHEGKIQNPKYYCVTKRQGKWYYINNEEVKQVNFKDFMTLNVFLLVYKREK